MQRQQPPHRPREGGVAVPAHGAPEGQGAHQSAQLLRQDLSQFVSSQSAFSWECTAQLAQLYECCGQSFPSQAPLKSKPWVSDQSADCDLVQGNPGAPGSASAGSFACSARLPSSVAHSSSGCSKGLHLRRWPPGPFSERPDVLHPLRVRLPPHSVHSHAVLRRKPRQRLCGRPVLVVRRLQWTGQNLMRLFSAPGDDACHRLMSLLGQSPCRSGMH